MRGRKKIKDPKNEIISIRITSAQKEILNKNDWIKKDIINMIRKYLNTYL